ncbi:MAG TPA: amidohydrolase [Planctomycetota bacterium]|nr:amidohydrolase [Planctomycetota bacterium]
MTDLLLLNGNIRTMDPERPRARSVACAKGLIESLDEAPPARRVLDLEGKTVIPGIIDAHVHLLNYGRRQRELDLSGVADYDVLIERVVERAKQAPKGSWITGSGYELDGHPHHSKLSAATPDHPVWLVRKDAHSGLANGRAMAMADLSVLPPGGTVLRERGVFLENAQGLISRLVPEEAPAAAFLAAQRDAIQAGITGIHDAMVDEDYLRLLVSLDEGKSLRLRVHAMVWHPDPDRLIDLMRSRKPTSGRLSVRAIKLFMDGSLGSSTAWMSEPYCGTDSTGLSTLDPRDAERVCRAALETGWQVCAHAIGDRANHELLNVYERVNPPPEARWRIEHAQHVHPSDLPRFARWIASVQPSHCVADRNMIERRLGPGRYEGCYAWKSLGRLALGTDAPVDRLDPRWTYTCAVTRDGWRLEQCLSPEEALAGMTSGAAYAGFMESGVLSPGRPADMVVLSDDWLACSPEAVLSTEVLATLMDGRVGYQSNRWRR